MHTIRTVHNQSQQIIVYNAVSRFMSKCSLELTAQSVAECTTKLRCTEQVRYIRCDIVDKPPNAYQRMIRFAAASTFVFFVKTGRNSRLASWKESRNEPSSSTISRPPIAMSSKLRRRHLSQREVVSLEKLISLNTQGLAGTEDRSIRDSSRSLDDFNERREWVVVSLQPEAE